jgi:type II secretory pathway pseudopilin PulG
MMMMTSRSNTMKTAMALNNVAVAMLEQGNFHDALQVFHDALLVTQVLPATPPGVDFQQHQAEGILLHTARSQLMAQQQLQQKGKTKTPLFGEQLQICPCDDGDVAFMKNALECVSVFVPIRLRSRELYDHQEQQLIPTTARTAGGTTLVAK